MAIESTLQIAPDIWRITLPLPFRLRAVHLYLVRGADGYSLIDAGLDTQAARLSFDDALQRLGVRPSQITRLYVTHMHPDHIGMSGRHARSGARAFIMPDEERRARYVWGTAPLEWAEYLRSHGMPDAAAAGATALPRTYVRASRCRQSSNQSLTATSSPSATAQRASSGLRGIATIIICWSTTPQS